MTKEEVRRQMRTGLLEALEHIDPSGENAKALLSFMPQETVANILKVYRLTKGLKEKYPRIHRKKDGFPEKDFERIEKILMKHVTQRVSDGHKMNVTQGFIEREGVERIMTRIRGTFRRSNKGLTIIRSELTGEEIKRKKITKYSDDPLNFVIYLFGEHMAALPKPPTWQLVCDFLQEQLPEFNQADVIYDGPALGDRYRKLERLKIEERYEFYRKLLLRGALESVRPLIFDPPHYDSQRYYRETDILLPPLAELLP